VQLLAWPEPYFTTKDVGKGTGLGLATVYGIVRQNEGFIEVSSAPGQGTAFSVYLPRYEGELSSVPGTDPAAAKHGVERGLLVEDERAVREMGRLILERLGYRVITAGTPGEALRLADEHGEEIHLLMTDVIMPEMKGRNLADRLIPFNPHLKLLFMSGYTADVIARNDAIKEGVAFIQKPFSINDLSAKLREVLDGP
jgi:two-component system, cell cycle sensor histidine kinase and response regulator CckA